jgi:hypothetical protein
MVFDRHVVIQSKFIAIEVFAVTTLIVAILSSHSDSLLECDSYFFNFFPIGCIGLMSGSKLVGVMWVRISNNEVPLSIDLVLVL